MLRNRLVIASLAAAITLTLAGCGPSTTDQVKSAMTSTTGTSQVVGDTGQATPTTTASQPTATATAVPPTATPTQPPTPTPVPTPATLPLSIKAKGFGQDDHGMVGYGFIIENPNPGQAVERSQYQVAAYDANGTVLKTDSSYITVLFPGEKLGIAGNLFLPDGATIDHLDVQVKTGQFEALDQVPSFTVENVQYVADKYFPKATAVVKSPYQKDLENIIVSAIAYDGDGNIIGGGFTFLDFVPANGQAAVEVSVTASSEPASVELYPTLSGLSLLGE